MLMLLDHVALNHVARSMYLIMELERTFARTDVEIESSVTTNSSINHLAGRPTLATSWKHRDCSHYDFVAHPSWNLHDDSYESIEILCS